MASARGKAAQSDRELRATESGARIQHERQSLRERKADREASTEQQNLNRWQRQWEQRRADRAQRDADRAKTQADKPRTTMFGTEGRDPNAPASMDQQRLDESKRQFDVSTQQREQQFQQSQELSAAKSGLMQGGGGAPDTGQRDMDRVGQALEQNPDDPRLQKMMAEMMRGRQQMGQGVEQTGRRGYVPTPEAQREGAYGAETARMQAQTARANAVIRQQELALKAQQLQAEIDGGGAGSKEAQAKLKAVNKSQQKKLDTSINLQIALSTGKATDKQWSSLQQQIDEGTEGGIAGEVWKQRQDEVNAREFGPGLKSLLSEGTMTKFVEFVSLSQGKFPEGVIPDVSTEAWQKFTRNGKVAAQMLRSGLNAELYPVQETEAWKRQVNMLAAFLTLSGRGEQMQMPEQARTGESDVMRGASGQLQEEVQIPGRTGEGSTTRRQIPEGPPQTFGLAPKPEGPVGPYQGFSAMDMAGVQ